MKALAFAALFSTALLANMAAEAAAVRPGPGKPLPHICPAGQSWQYGCVKYGHAPPGKLFGACLQKGWSCVRKQQIQ